MSRLPVVDTAHLCHPRYEHMELIGEWGFDFKSFYAAPCPTNVSTRLCLPMGGCNSRHVAAMRPGVTYDTVVVKGLKIRCTP